MKNFLPSSSTMKIQQVKSFLGRIHGVSLFHQVVIVMKIKPGENLTGEIFCKQKIPIYGSYQSIHSPQYVGQLCNQTLVTLSCLYEACNYMYMYSTCSHTKVVGKHPAHLLDGRSFQHIYWMGEAFSISIG